MARTPFVAVVETDRTKKQAEIKTELKIGKVISSKKTTKTKASTPLKPKK